MFRRSLLTSLVLTMLATPAFTLSCEILFQKEGEYVTLEAVASNHGPTRGNYVLGVTVISGSNSSTSMQSGPVAIETAGEKIVLARSVMRVTRQTRFTAQVTIETADGRTRCKTHTEQGEDI